MNAPTLFVIAADLTKMQVVANIDESDVGQMRPGQTVSFRVDAYPTDNFLGSVHAGAAPARRRPERRHVFDGHRRAESAAEAEAGHDRERQHRDRAPEQRAARADRGAAVPADRRRCSRCSTSPCRRKSCRGAGGFAADAAVTVAAGAVTAAPARAAPGGAAAPQGGAPQAAPAAPAGGAAAPTPAPQAPAAQAPAGGGRPAPPEARGGGDRMAANPAAAVPKLAGGELAADAASIRT